MCQLIWQQQRWSLLHRPLFKIRPFWEDVNTGQDGSGIFENYKKEAKSEDITNIDRG